MSFPAGLVRRNKKCIWAKTRLPANGFSIRPIENVQGGMPDTIRGSEIPKSGQNGPIYPDLFLCWTVLSTLICIYIYICIWRFLFCLHPPPALPPPARKHIYENEGRKIPNIEKLTDFRENMFFAKNCYTEKTRAWKLVVFTLMLSSGRIVRPSFGRFQFLFKLYRMNVKHILNLGVHRAALGRF
jgi:hypothetical protein